MASALYQAQILDHYRHPRNKGVLPEATVSARDANLLCGDEVAFYLRVDGGGRVADARFDGHGCAISQASASIVSTMLGGRTLEELESIDREVVLEALGVPITGARLKCALLPLDVLRLVLQRAKSPPASG